MRERTARRVKVFEASGAIDGPALITGRTGLDGVPAAFEALRPSDGSASRHLKILVDPRSTTAAF